MKLEILEKNKYYHIYNRGINGANIFESNENMRYFLSLINKYLSNKVTVLSYCLLNNHYHLLVKIDCESEVATQLFSNLFNAYAKAFNNQQNRTGSLFEKHFKRKHISTNENLKNTVLYIHKNPESHNLVSDFSTYPFSSYSDILENQASIISVNEVLSLFETLDNFSFCHRNTKWNTIIETQDTYKVLKTLQENKVSYKNKFYQYILELQNTITTKLEEIDGVATFKEDIWKRQEGGGGKTRVIENGGVFEKGGVNISKVYGELPEALRKQFGVEEGNFFACGLSLVLHPKNPFVPTVHANWRYFEMYDDTGNLVTQWFGGGQDLTPYYLFEQDAVHFHTVCKNACDKHDVTFYPTFKETCDNYFWNNHRDEARGIGGLFFDYLKETEKFSIQDRYNFVTEVGDSFLESYVPIVEKRKECTYNTKHKNWQEIRRGRYVEFNLVHDRGTLFGLKTNGRIESILMSLPPKVQWVYNYQPEKNSEEEKLLTILKKPTNWI